MHKKAEALRFRICEHVQSLDIPGYLVCEAEKFLDYVNYYKLQNIYKHVGLFCDYLIYLDGLYLEQLEAMLRDSKKVQSAEESVMTKEDDMYFLSQSDRQQLVDGNLYTIWSEAGFDRYQLLSVIIRIKGLFLLSGTEFCHASTTRLSLHQRVFHNEKHPLANEK